MRQEGVMYAQSSKRSSDMLQCIGVRAAWALTKAEQNLLERTEIRMLRLMMGIKLGLRR